MTSPLATALAVELLKLRRSAVARVVTPVLVLLIPLASLGAVALARAPRVPGTAAAKFAPFATGPLAVAQLAVTGQIVSVAVLVVGGFAAAWSYGRELADGYAGALFGLAVPRSAIALAKGLLLAAWLAACVFAAVLLTIVLALATGGQFDAQARASARVALGAGLLGVGLVLPFGWVATVTRSPLGTVGVLIGLVAITQVVVVLGAGSWFPYAVPSLWAGAGGPAAAADVTAGALWVTAAVGPAGLAAVAAAWARMTNV